MREEEEEQFQSSNTCWTCEKLIDNHDEKVGDDCHITGKFRGAAHWSCNINHCSHLIFRELNNLM